MLLRQERAGKAEEGFYKPLPHRSCTQTAVWHIHAARPPFKWPCCRGDHACSHVQGIFLRPWFAKDFRRQRSSACAWQAFRRKSDLRGGGVERGNRPRAGI